MPRSQLPISLSVVATLALLVAASVARAQSSEGTTPDAPAESAGQVPESKARADRLFQEGRRLIGERRFVEACTRLEQSLALDVAGGTLLNLSQCYEATSRFASADACLERASKLAREKGRTDVTEFIDGERARLASRIDRLTIGLPTLPAGAIVTLDGRRIDPSQSSSIAIDPGAHLIAVSAPNHEAEQQAFDVSPNEGEGKLIEVQVAPLVPRASSKRAAGVDGPAPPRRGHRPEAAAADSESDHDAMVYAGAATTAVGGAALVAGGILGILAAVTWSEVEDRCPAVRCDDREAIDGAERASLFAGLSTGLLIGGGVTGGVGVTLLVVAPAPAERSLAFRFGASF